MFAKMGNKRVDVINLKLESVFRCCKRRIITSVKILKKAVSLRFVDSLSVNVEKKEIYQKATIRLIHMNSNYHFNDHLCFYKH